MDKRKRVKMARARKRKRRVTIKRERQGGHDTTSGSEHPPRWSMAELQVGDMDGKEKEERIKGSGEGESMAEEEGGSCEKRSKRPLERNEAHSPQFANPPGPRRIHHAFFGASVRSPR